MTAGQSLYEQIRADWIAAAEASVSKLGAHETACALWGIAAGLSNAQASVRDTQKHNGDEAAAEAAVITFREIHEEVARLCAESDYKRDAFPTGRVEQLQAAADARDSLDENAAALDDPKSLILNYGPAAAAMFGIGQDLRAAVVAFDVATKGLYPLDIDALVERERDRMQQSIEELPPMGDRGDDDACSF
jgi:hypothetical protein